MDTTRTLSRFLVASRREDIPAEVRHEASRAFVNALGCAIGSARHETVERALAAVQPFSGPPQATVFGRSERLDALHAALVNGVALHVLDFDDTHQRTVHPTAPILPALLAYCEWRSRQSVGVEGKEVTEGNHGLPSVRSSGRGGVPSAEQSEVPRPVTGGDLVHAFVLGVEAEIRIALSVFPEHYDRGWHITGTAGVFGAAAAIGKLLGLDEQRMSWALGIAATQAAGLHAMFGSMCKSLHPARAAQNGMTAALLAAQGFTSSERGIEAPRGFARVASPKFDPDIVTRGLGESWELTKNMYKPFACGLVVHAAIDACIQLKREHAFEPDAIERVELRTSPLVPELCGNPAPENGLAGKFSVYHAAAAALVHGAAGEAQFADDVVRNPVVIALRERVSVTADAAVRKLEAHATIRLRDGRVLDKHVEHALGTVERPMVDRELEDKFRGLTERVLDDAQAATIMELCWRIESLDDSGELARATAIS